MNLLRKIILWIAVTAIFCSACSDYNKLLKSTDYNKKYDAAIKYYDKGDYVKSLALLEELVSVYRGTEKGEKILYYYAYATYFSGSYIMAGYYFNNFVKTFPVSSHAEECAYMYAYCFYLESPRYSLDQTDTKNAIKELQYFINKYPGSTRMKECNELGDKLRSKLEKKYYEISKQYFFLDDYKAAVISFENLLKDFPDTKYREEVMFLILKSNYIYAIRSIETKKEERCKSTIDAYYKFKSYYSENSKYIKDAENIFTGTKKYIEQSHKNKS